MKSIIERGASPLFVSCWLVEQLLFVRRITSLGKLDRGLKWAAELGHPEAIFYLAGADPYKKDKLGGLSVSKKGLLERDRRVFEFCRKQSVPTAITLAGGYAEDVNDIVDIQFRTILLANQLLTSSETS